MANLFKTIFGKYKNDENDDYDPWANTKDGFYIPGKVSLTFFDPDKKQFGAIIFTPNELFSIDPEHHHDGEIVKKARGKNENLKMYMYADSDVIRHKDHFDSKFHKKHHKLETKEGTTSRHSLWKKHLEFKDTFFHSKLTPDNEETRGVRRRRLQRVVFTNCYPGQRTTHLATMKVGVLMDAGFVKQSGPNKAGGTRATADAVLAKYFTDTNALYEPQTFASMTIGSAFTGAALNNGGIPQTLDVEKTNPNADGRTAQCTDAPTPLSASERLYRLRDWRNNHFQTRPAQQPDTHGVWHLMTSCHPEPGTVGIAFIGVLCHNRYGVGLSSTLRYGTIASSWKTVAHELGHNYGANHSFENGQGRTGGIMDYGDGLFQGVFQFNPLRKTEVCGHLTNVIAATNSPSFNIPPNQCWEIKAINAPAPTTYSWVLSNPLVYGPCSRTCGTGSQLPVYRCQANPAGTIVADNNCVSSAKPVGTPRACNTQACPQPTPPPTPPPTKRPTNAPIPAPVPQPTPPPVQAPTNPPQPTQAPRCGNGSIDRGEYCDPAVGAAGCCINNCQLWRTNNACRAANPFVDAAYLDNQRRLHTFLGEYYARYPAPAAGQDYPDTPETGFPKAIARSFNNWPFTANIGAIIRIPTENILMVFQGLNYFQYDLNPQNARVIAGVRSAATDLNLPADFVQCGNVDAAVSLQTRGVLFCDDKYVVFNYGQQVTATTSTPLNNQGNIFRSTYFTQRNEYINRWSAAFSDPLTNKVRAYMGNQHTQYLNGPTVDQGYPKVTKSMWASVGGVEPTSAECVDRNCAQCTSDGLTCNQCKPNFYKFISGNCLTLRTIITLIFSQNSAADNQFVTVPTNVQYTQGQSGGQAIVFTPTTKIQGRPITAQPGQSTVVTNFQITAWYRPTYDEVTDPAPLKARFFTVEAGNPGPGQCDKITIDFQHHCRTAISQEDCQKAPRGADCSWVNNSCQYKDCRFATQQQCAEYLDRQCTWNGTVCQWQTNAVKPKQTFAIEVVYCKRKVNCYVSTAIETNKWNKINIRFEDSLFTTAVGALSHKVGAQTATVGTNEDTMDYSIDWAKATWFLGSDGANGNPPAIKGHIDNFSVERIESSGPTSASTGGDSESMGKWEVTGVIIGAVFGALVLSIGTCLMLSKYRRYKRGEEDFFCWTANASLISSQGRRSTIDEVHLSEMHTFNKTSGGVGGQDRPRINSFKPHPPVFPAQPLSNVVGGPVKTTTSGGGLPPRPKTKPRPYRPDSVASQSWQTNEGEGAPLSPSGTGTVSGERRRSSVVPSQAAPRRPPPAPLSQPRGPMRPKPAVIKNFRASGMSKPTPPPPPPGIGSMSSQGSRKTTGSSIASRMAMFERK